MFRRGNQRGCVSVIGVGIHPTLTLIFHAVGGLLRDIAAVIAFDYTQREIDPGGKTAGGREISILNEPGAALELNVWKRHGETSERAVIGSCAFAIEEAGLGQNKCTSANRHRDVG